ncbi:MAG: hypothetical protein WCH39_29045, partial [Schlesneria sp.]
IVGILIILIVIAGLHVSKIPVVFLPPGTNLSDEPVSELAQFAPAKTNKSDEATQEPQQQELTMQEPEDESELEPETQEMPVRPPLPELVVPQELVEMTKELETVLASITKEELALAARVQQSSLRQVELTERQKAVQEMLTVSAQQLDASKMRKAKAVADLELARKDLERLAKQIEEIEDKPVNVQTLEHKITPISRVVNGNEKHYRLERNRVSEVPVDELVSRLKDQIQKRKDWLVKTRQHQGQIGPVEGFNMQYLVRVETLSGLDELRTGQGGYRISLSNWQIHPEPETKGETAEVALRKGSKFYQSILGAAPDTTLTFWVYPDSYAIYRKLQKFTHDHGFSVAGRPLPVGVPISGSPNGSKSASQ